MAQQPSIAQASLEGLPTEILTRIAAQLKKNDLISLAASSKALIAIAEAPIYSNIVVDPEEPTGTARYKSSIHRPAGFSRKDPGWRLCSICGLKVNCHQAKTHHIRCQERTAIQSLAKRILSAVVVRGRRAHLDKLWLYPTAGTMSSFELVLAGLSTTVKDVRFTTRPWEADLHEANLEYFLSLLVNNPDLRSVFFDPWPVNYDPVKNLPPLLMSMPKLQRLRLSLD